MYRLIGGCALVLIAFTAASSTGTRSPWDPVATFSILGFDPATGELGGAVQSRVFSVGNGVLWAEAGVGAVATQAIVDVSYGPQCLALLKKGMTPVEVVDAANRLNLPNHVGQRVSVTGLLVDREMTLRSLQRVSASCD